MYSSEDVPKWLSQDLRIQLQYITVMYSSINNKLKKKRKRKTCGSSYVNMNHLSSHPLNGIRGVSNRIPASMKLPHFDDSCGAFLYFTRYSDHKERDGSCTNGSDLFNQNLSVVLYEWEESPCLFCIAGSCFYNVSCFYCRLFSCILSICFQRRYHI